MEGWGQRQGSQPRALELGIWEVTLGTLPSESLSFCPLALWLAGVPSKTMCVNPIGGRGSYRCWWW